MLILVLKLLQLVDVLAGQLIFRSQYQQLLQVLKFLYAGAFLTFRPGQSYFYMFFKLLAVSKHTGYGETQPSHVDVELLPEAAGARSHGRGAASLLVCDALRAEVFGEEVQLVRRGLEGQLVQFLLR